MLFKQLVVIQMAKNLNILWSYGSLPFTQNHYSVQTI